MKTFPKLASLALATLPAPLALGQASFHLLGPYSSGSTSYIVRDVSADGRIVLGNVPFVGPFTWTSPGGFTFLPTPQAGDFPAAASGSALHLAPQELSPDARSMVGVAVFDDGRHQGFHWAASTGYRPVPGIAATPSFARSFATTSNATGTLIGGWMLDPNHKQPVVWDLTMSTDAIPVPLLAGHVHGVVEDIADGADVAVGTSFASYNSLPHAFRWTASGGTKELPPPGGMHDAHADCISADGTVAFGAAQMTPGGEAMLVRWDAQGRSERIGTPPVGHTSLRVVAANADGTAAVGISSSFIYNETSFYWSEATGFVELESLLESRGAAITGSTSHRMLVRGMSADGNTIAGSMNSYGGSAVTIGFIARLAPDAPGPIGVDLCGAGVVNSIGATPELEATGSEVLTHNDVVLEVRDLPGRSFGFLLASQTQGWLPGFGGGLGTQCLGTSFGLLSRPGGAPPAGIFQRVAVRLDLPTLPLSTGAVTIQPGDTWHFQFWYRDRGAVGPTTNLSSARSITFQ